MSVPTAPGWLDPGTPGNPLNTQASIFYGVVAVGLIIASDFAPWLINGLLILILVGLILRHTGAVDQFISSGVAATSKG